MSELEELRLAWAECSRQKHELLTAHKHSAEHIRVLREALEDMLNGWRYIRDSHGDLYGVGWDRAQDKAEKALEGTK